MYVLSKEIDFKRTSSQLASCKALFDVSEDIVGSLERVKQSNVGIYVTLYHVMGGIMIWAERKRFINIRPYVFRFTNNLNSILIPGSRKS